MTGTTWRGTGTSPPDTSTSATPATHHWYVGHADDLEHQEGRGVAQELNNRVLQRLRRLHNIIHIQFSSIFNSIILYQSLKQGNMKEMRVIWNTREDRNDVAWHRNFTTGYFNFCNACNTSFTSPLWWNHNRSRQD
jgi:hypothetical protein